MINLDGWDLTTPVGSPVEVVSTEALLARKMRQRYFAQYSNKIVFRAPVTGGHTSGSSFPRSELRETYSDGSQRNWYYNKQNNHMQATLAVNQVPSTSKVIIGQIHVKDYANPLLTIRYQTGKNGKGEIVAYVRQKPGTFTQRVMTLPNVSLGEKFTYKVHLTTSGKLSIKLGDQYWRAPLSTDWKKKMLYFKAGAYVLDNKGSSSEAGKVSFYKLSYRHGGTSS